MTIWKKVRENWVGLIGSVLVCQMAGIIGSFFTFSAIEEWYKYLEKPVFSPPNWLFGPVWTVLYALMGIAWWLVRKKEKETSSITSLFLVHLAVNALWSVIFFGMRNPLGALGVIGILWVMIGIIIVRFFKIDKKAGYLLVPYFLWVSFASVLNLSIWKLN